MDIDAQIVHFRLLHLQHQNMCTCTAVQLSNTRRKEWFCFQCLSAMLTRASLRQPQANTIGQSPKGSCRVANNKLTSQAITSSLFLKRTAHVRPKKGGNRGTETCDTSCIYERTISATLTYDQNTLLESMLHFFCFYKWKPKKSQNTPVCKGICHPAHEAT